MHATELFIIAHGAASLDGDELRAMRQQSVPRFSATLRPQLLKHSDEQTLAAAVALDRAIAQLAHGEEPGFSCWAIVSATRYLGRTAFAAVIDKYQIDGPWGVSVHGIPHASPHALASSLSLALGSHGPCLGAAGAPGKEWQAILTSAALLSRTDVPGVWLIVSGWSGESTDDTPGGMARCHAAALALVTPDTASRLAAPRLGRVVIEPERAAGERLAARDLLRCVASGESRDRQIEIHGGGLSSRIELCCLSEFDGTYPRPVQSLALTS